MSLSLGDFARCVPGCPSSLVGAYYPFIASALAEFEVSTPQRVAAWLAQNAFETNSFREMVEDDDGTRYEGRADLGNTQPGDGPRFKGRGCPQLTGRANYAAAAQALGMDLLGRPELAATPGVCFRIGGWYWQSRGLNELADLGTQDAFDQITRRINGGLNGKPFRDANWRRCRGVLMQVC